MTIESPSTENREAVRRLFAEIAECPADSYVILTPEDPFFQDAQPVRIKPVAELGGLEVGEFVHLAPIFDTDGRKLEQPGDEWWKTALADVDFNTWRAWQITPNAVLRLGAVVAVSLGEYRFARTLTVDGVEVAELVTLDEQSRRDRAERDAWLAEHPELLTATSWHETVQVDDLHGLDGVGIWFEHDYGSLRLVKHASHHDGVLTWDDDSNAPEVIIDRDAVEDLSVTQMRELASALMAAIPVVEAATA